MKTLEFIRYGIARLGIVLIWLIFFALMIMLSRLHWAEQNAITIFTFSAVFDAKMVQEFEQKTGIRVHLNYANSNEELLVKLRSGAQYDLIVLSDYAIPKVLELGLLKELDRSKIPFINHINPVLLGHAFDAHNKYVIPFEWELYIIGFSVQNSEMQNVEQAKAWDYIFKPYLFGPHYRFIMVNDPVEVIAMATNYLFGDEERLDEKKQQQVIQLLKSQRPWIEAYSNVRTDYYLGTHNATAGLAQSPEIWRAIRDYHTIDFVVPEKTFVTIEHCALPVTTNKDDFVYQFLNFMYSKEIMKRHVDIFYYCPARLDVIDMLNIPDKQKNIMRSSPEIFGQYIFIKDKVSEQAMHDIWVSIKSGL